MKLPWHVLAIAACAATGFGAGCSAAPLGEVVVHVDTDASVPQLVSRLRVDAYDASGRWYETREFARTSPADWPASFSVYSPTAGTGGVIKLRVRAYLDGKLRDYRGERFMPRPTDRTGTEPAPLPPATDVPRLVDANGVDRTPRTEPQPLVTIDRIATIIVQENRVRHARIVLRGACFGTMADMAKDETCTDTENERAQSTAGIELSDAAPAYGSLAGTFAPTTPCKLQARTGPDAEACVPGGAFVFGSATRIGDRTLDGTPERIAIIRPFLMDLYEVSVSRLRNAFAAGLNAESPIANPNAMPSVAPSSDPAGDVRFCTWSTADRGRESYPVNCISQASARAFCEFNGRDLPTEAEWEYAAAWVGRAAKTTHPWGGPDEVMPTCEQAVFARGWPVSIDEQNCSRLGIGPAPIGAGGGDRTAGLGIADMGGSLAEIVLDSAASLGSNCWLGQPLEMPHCQDPRSAHQGYRGGRWSSLDSGIDMSQRGLMRLGGGLTVIGFRCVRRERSL